MRRVTLLAATVAALASAQPASAAANLIANGGFDIPGAFSEFTLITAATRPAGFAWDVTGSVDVFRTDSRFGGEPDPTNGDPNALDLVGTGTVGGIAQAFATAIGATYRLTFEYANNPGVPGAAMDVGVRDGAANLFKNNVAHAGSTTGAMNWLGYQFDFVATGDLSTLFFTNTAIGSGFVNGGMYLDNIRVEKIAEAPGGVPEPATWALMIGGFGLAGASLRQRRRTASAAAA